MIANRLKSDSEPEWPLDTGDVHTTLASEAIRKWRTALARSGVRMPSEEGLKRAIDSELTQAEDHLGQRDIPSLIDAKEMTHPEKKNAMQLLMNLSAGPCLDKPAFRSWIFAKMTNLSLRHGHVPESSVAYAEYGKLLAEGGDYQSGYSFGLLGLEISEKFQDMSCKCQVCFIFGAFLNHWVKHAKWTQSLSTEGYEAASLSGDPEWAGAILAINSSLNSFFQGKNLGRMLADLRNFQPLIQNTQNMKAYDIVRGCELAVSELIGLAPEGAEAFSLEADHETYLSRCHSHESFIALCAFHLFKARLLYLHEKPVQALHHIVEAKKFLNFATGTVLIADHNFYSSLILTALYLQAPPDQRKTYLENMDANQEQMRIWSESCQENFLHKYLLVQAERLRITQNTDDAILLYDRAIESAGENEFIQDEALANELASKFWIVEGNHEIAELYMKMAHYGYRLWGAKCKTEEMERRHADLLTKPASPEQASEESASLSRYAAMGDASALLDMATVMKASQAISGEIVLENLLKKLMDIVMETAGAEKGFLILKSDFKNNRALMVESHVSADKCKEAQFQGVPVEDCAELSPGIVHHTAQTCKNLVLNDPAEKGEFTQDAYVREHKPRSILCIPIIPPPSIPQSRDSEGVTGLLYLENNKTSGAFTPDRVEVLRLLSSQAAISIDNARIYSRYRSLYENAVEGIFQSTPQGRYLSANPSLAKMLGYDSPAEMLSAVTDIWKQLHVDPKDIETFERVLNRDDQIIGFETRFFRKDQNVIWVSISARAVRDGRRNLLYYEGSVLDVTTRKEKQKAESARKAAEAANSAKSDFLASMSHEIRTPMNAIIGLTGLVLNTGLNLKQRNYLTKVHSSAYALLGILNDILDFSKIEAGKLDIETKEFQLQQILEDIADLFVDQAAEKGIDLFIGKNQDVPSALIGDPLRVKQILINLTGNAVKFTHSGKIFVNVTCLEKRQEEAVLLFSVKDTGIGISQEQMGRLFSAFTQADSSTTRKYGGTGLGLAISEKLINLMGGRISAESVPDQGSTFSFTLPLVRQPEEKEPAYNLVSELCGLKTLIVDDDEISRQIIKDMAPFGIQAESAASGMEALAKLKEGAATKNPYQLVLMDWKMPELDGMATSKRIREDPQLANIPIIMITAFASEKEMNQAERTRVDAFLIKPIKQSLLIDTLMEIFGGSKLETRNLKLETSDQAKFQVSSTNILLVEDNEINQELAWDILHEAGMAVDTANNGREAVVAVCPDNSAQAPYDLILMDIQLPEMDGLEATRRIREWEKARRSTLDAESDLQLAHGSLQLPIIAMTAHAMAGDREKCLKAGMDDYITKPVDPGQLIAMIRKWTASKRRASQTSAIPHPVPDDRSDVSLPGFQSLPGIDVMSALQRFRGNKALFIKLMKNFASNYAGIANEIREAMAVGDMEDVRHRLHTLEGISGNLSATELYASVQALRTALNEILYSEEESAGALLLPETGWPHEIEQAVGLMEENLLRVLESARILDQASDAQVPEEPEPSGDSASIPSSDLSGITRKLVEIDRLLAENNIAAEDCIESAKKYLIHYNGVGRTYQHLEAQMAKFDFRGAQKTMAKIADVIGVSLSGP